MTSCPARSWLLSDHRGFRPPGWIEAGRERLEAMRPIAERAGLTMIQLACQWNLAHDARRLRRADADPGGRSDQRAPSRPSVPNWPRCRRQLRLTLDRRRRDPRARRQHGLHGAEGRQPESSGEERPTAGASPASGGGRRPLGDRAGPRPHAGPRARLSGLAAAPFCPHCSRRSRAADQPWSSAVACESASACSARTQSQADEGPPRPSRRRR